MIDEATREYMEKNAVAVVAKAIEDGAFDDQIEAVLIETVRNGKDDGLTELGFLLKMAVELIDLSASHLSFTRAKQKAADILREFRRDSGNPRFGDEGWDWSGSAARLLVHEYETNYWV